MSLRKRLIAICLMFVATAAVPSRASADWMFTPFIGTSFGGSANVSGGGSGSDASSDFKKKLNYGASLAGMGNGVFGFELDFGYAPNFFADATATNLGFVGDGNVTTLMGNMIIGASGGPIRPYVTGGIGLIKSKLDSPSDLFKGIDSTDFGFDAGGGLMCFFSQNVGLRGDVRLFRSFNNVDLSSVDFKLGDFKFWRGSVGLTFKF